VPLLVILLLFFGKYPPMDIRPLGLLPDIAVIFDWSRNFEDVRTNSSKRA